jgi:hypothetical protein
MMDKSQVSPPNISVISPSLLKTYITLRGGARNVFKRLYYGVWSYLLPVSRLDVIAFSYAIPIVLRDRPGITITMFSMMSRLWIYTVGGSVACNSVNYTFVSVDRRNISRLISLGFVKRTSFDPAHPYNIKPNYIQRTWISLTPEGISFYNGVVKQVYKIVQDDTLASMLDAKQ